MGELRSQQIRIEEEQGILFEMIRKAFPIGSSQICYKWSKKGCLVEIIDHNLDLVQIQRKNGKIDWVEYHLLKEKSFDERISEIFSGYNPRY